MAIYGEKTGSQIKKKKIVPNYTNTTEKDTISVQKEEKINNYIDSINENSENKIGKIFL